ncbi:MAG TPA: M48 family metalloprotease, partial [Thermoanaerobaculia bacterium]|nr:M48 family metalloprotease [Thermoanaerobaculia bacterium]
IVNAMALPGGYVYVTRGMLERINSEDELAGVIGHEIAHVTARHSAQQISKQQLAQVGLVLGAVVAGPEVLQQYGQLAQLGLGLLFQRYSRQHETEADLLGTGYMARAHYNPVGSERMLMTLQRMDKNPSGGIDKYFESHPDPAKRVRDVRAKITEMGGMLSAGNFEPPNRDEFVRLLDGSITGASTEHTVIRNGVVYDRDHGIVVRAPQGWTATTQPGVLFAMTPTRDNGSSYFVAQEVNARELQGRNAQDAIRVRLQQMGLAYVGARDARLGTGERFPVDVWQGQTQAGAVGVETTQFVHGNHVVVMMFVSPGVSTRNSPMATVLQQMDVRPSQAQSAQPARLRIGAVRSGETWSDLARRATGNTRDAEALANINGFDLDQAPQSGMMVKLPEEIVRDR